MTGDSNPALKPDLFARPASRLLRLAASASALASLVGCASGVTPTEPGIATGAATDAAATAPDGLGYYLQSVRGHFDLMARARPISDWLADPETSPALRQRLQLAQQIREFAVKELSLPDNASYRRYADLGRPAAVWNVVAAPELSLKLKTWCFPVMGCVGYRGYFARGDADAQAQQLRAEGLEASVYGVPAYSTLGWSNWLGGDPLLNTFVNGSESALARLIFHELAHQVAYARDDTRFNESYATAVERLGLTRWHAVTGRPDDEAVAAQQRAADFKALTRRTRTALQALYASDLAVAVQRQRKAALMAGLQVEYAALKASSGGPWAGYTGYDRWFANASNASLALLTAYDGWVPEFERLFARQGRDFARFHAEVRRLAALPGAERTAALQAMP